MEWVVFLCILPTLTSAVSAFIGGIGVVRPDNPYIYIGENLTLTCNLTKYDIAYDSRSLQFTRKNDEVIPSQFINITTTRSITLKYPITSPDDKGQYLCLLNRLSGRPEIVGSQRVTVEYKPKSVEKIDCRVYNWENMTCVWDLKMPIVNPDLMEVKLIWTINNRGSSVSQSECPHQTNTSCSWWHIDEADSFVSGVTYLVMVSIYNKKLDRYYDSKITYVTTDRRVKPAPVIDLVANSSSTCVTSSWSHSMFRRDKVYRVQFKAENEVTWNVKHVDDMQTFTQCDLVPNTVYEFSVTCKPRNHGFWSDNITIVVTTKEDVPSKAPEVLPGSYTEQLCQQNNCKKLMLYWKPVNPEDANGDIVRYELMYKNLDKSKDDSIGEASNNYKSFVLLAGDRYLINLRAATKMGVSKAQSAILVPPIGQKPEVPELIVEAKNMSEQTLIYLRWDTPKVWSSPFWKNLTSFTVFWCKGLKISQNCYDSIQWQELPITQTNLGMPVGQYDDSFENYQFGVAVNAISRTGETISSGLRWNTCTYIINEKPRGPPNNVRFSTFKPNKGLSVEWDKLTCSESGAYITQYLVNVCPSEYGRNCTGATTTHTIDNKKSSFVITGLKHNIRYRVWINSVSAGGISPSSESVYDDVIDKSLNPGQISGIAIGGLFVFIVFLSAIILCTRRVAKAVKKKFEPVPIVVPPLPPLPPIPMPPQKWSPDTSPGSSEGIYERIDGPPSPSSSVDSSAGAEAPLIHKMKMNNGTMKDPRPGKVRKEQRDSNDSGKGSLSHSADTLLMRLHPSHIRKAREKKNKYRNNQSDSGIALDSRSQPSCSYTNGPCSDVSPYISVPVANGHAKRNTGETNPYSCVNIVDKIPANSEKLSRKMSSGNSSPDGGEQSGSTDKSYNTGSTISLPPPSCQLQTFQAVPLAFRTKSADNELDNTERKLESMKEAQEIDSSDVYSEDGTLDYFDPREQYSGSSGESREPPVSSYIKYGDGYVKDMNDDVTKPQSAECDCECHSSSNKQPVVVDGYVKQEMFANGQSEHICGCEKLKKPELLAPESSLACTKTGVRPVSQVMNLPPHFFGSYTMVPVDPARTTEL